MEVGKVDAVVVVDLLSNILYFQPLGFVILRPFGPLLHPLLDVLIHFESLLPLLNKGLSHLDYLVQLLHLLFLLLCLNPHIYSLRNTPLLIVSCQLPHIMFLLILLVIRQLNKPHCIDEHLILFPFQILVLFCQVIVTLGVAVVDAFGLFGCLDAATCFV